MDVEAIIFNTFTAWFDSDLIDVDDPQAVQDATGAWANDLIRSIPDVGAVIAVLSGLRDAWTPAAVGRFIRATHVDWLADGPTEQTLKNVLEVVVADLKGHQAYAYGD